MPLARERQPAELGDVALIMVDWLERYEGESDVPLGRVFVFKGGMALKIRLRDGNAAMVATGGSSSVRREVALPWGVEAKEAKIGPVVTRERSVLED